MDNKVELDIKLDPKRMYSSKEIQVYGLFPWIRDSRSITRLIREDFVSENILQAEIEGEGAKRRYRVKGENIIKYINNLANKKWRQKK